MSHAGDYKSSKESFVTGLSGSSVSHINLISAVALASIALYSTLSTRFSAWRNPGATAAWPILVIPLLLSMTVFAERPILLASALLLPTAVLLAMPPQEHGTPLPSNKYPESPTAASATPRITPLPALTTYRAHMMLMTILAILAVDFPVFPRYLAKCETYGVSLMDLGVGSFVFAQGIVSAIPLVKNPTHLNAPLVPKVVQVIRKALPVLFLGVLRVIVVKSTGYPEHESEYGRHWNFFFTLALVPVLQVLLHPVIKFVPISMLGVVVALVQQIALTFGGLEEFVLWAPRDSLLSANKEGLVSLTGYLSIHLLGLSLGTFILPPSPSYFRRIQRQLRSGRDMPTESLSTPRQNDKIATELCAYSLMWWGGMGFIRLFEVDGRGVSRQLVNLSYILWIAAFNTSFILGYLLLDMFFFAEPTKSKAKYKKVDDDRPPPPTTTPARAPALLEAINKNGLSLFLLANIATGLINLAIPTMYTSDFWAVFILSSYSYGICTVAWLCRRKKVLML